MCKNYDLNMEKRARWYECYISINDVIHRIYYKTTLDGMFHLYVDDKCVMTKKEWVAKLIGFDYPFEHDGEKLHCVYEKQTLDVAMWGKYMKSQKTYVSSKVMNRAFGAICMIGLALLLFVHLENEKIIEVTKTESVAFGLFCLSSVFICEKRVTDCTKKAEAYRKAKEDEQRSSENKQP